MGFVTFSAVVAVAENNIIGNNGRLPWQLKSDLQRFRTLTWGHPLIMGRKTFHSIGKPLPGRDNIVVTRGLPPSDVPPDVFYVASWTEAKALGQMRAAVRSVSEVFVIGGAHLFQVALPDCTKLYLTRVHAKPDGDITWVPPAKPEWSVVSQVYHSAKPGDDYGYTDFVMKRV